MFANKIEIAAQTAIRVTQTAIDASIFERTKDAPRELRQRKYPEYVADNPGLRSV